MLTVALPHHDASHGNQRSRGEAPLFSTKHTCDGNIATRANLAVGLDSDTSSEIVEDKGLVGLGETKLPRQTSVLDTGPSRGTGTTVVAGDEDMVGLSLRDTTCYDADADFGDELDGDTRTGVRTLQVVDELLQVLDRVNIVVGRGRNETDAGGGVTGARDRGGHLVSRQLTTLARFGSLGHLNLELVGICEVVGGHTEATGGNLLDRRAHGVAVGQDLRTLGIFTALSGVRLASETIHCNSKSRVGLHGDRAVRHSAGDETPDDLVPRLNLLDGNGSSGLETEVEETT